MESKSDPSLPSYVVSTQLYFGESSGWDCVVVISDVSILNIHIGAREDTSLR
jgi:hypothetical protein